MSTVLELLDIAEEYTMPLSVLSSGEEGMLKLAVLATLEDVIDPNFQGETIDESVEMSAQYSAKEYELSEGPELVSSLAHRILRDPRMADIIPRHINTIRSK